MYCIACVATYTTLWNISTRKQANIDKLQSRVATYLRGGGVATDQIKKGLLLSLSVNNRQPRSCSQLCQIFTDLKKKFYWPTKQGIFSEKNSKSVKSLQN